MPFLTTWCENGLSLFKVFAHELSHFVYVFLYIVVLLITNKPQLSVAFLYNHADTMHLVDRIHLLDLQVYAASVLVDHFVYITYPSI